MEMHQLDKIRKRSFKEAFGEIKEVINKEKGRSLTRGKKIMLNLAKDELITKFSDLKINTYSGENKFNWLDFNNEF